MSLKDLKDEGKEPAYKLKYDAISDTSKKYIYYNLSPESDPINKDVGLVKNISAGYRLLNPKLTPFEDELLGFCVENVFYKSDDTIDRFQTKLLMSKYINVDNFEYYSPYPNPAKPFHVYAKYENEKQNIIFHFYEM